MSPKPTNVYNYKLCRIAVTMVTKVIELPVAAMVMRTRQKCG